MLHKTVTRTVAVFLCLLLMALLILFAVNEFEKNRAFQWESMVQPHWEGATPHSPTLMLPPSTDDTDADIDSVSNNNGTSLTAPTTAQHALEHPTQATPAAPKTEPQPELEKTTAHAKEVEKHVKTTKQEEKSPKKIIAKNNDTEPTKKSTGPKGRKLNLHMPDNIYQGRTAKWEQKKKKVMPDFFAPKSEGQNDIQLGGRLIMDDETNAETSNNTNKKNQSNVNDYLDSIKGAEVNISIKMR